MPTPATTMEFIDLKEQYRRYKSAVDDRIHQVLDHRETDTHSVELAE